MVFPLKLTKFYGSSLPRPRIYTNPNGNERIDPPLSVTDPLMSWAQEAHWSMGGVSFKRLRLMGKIEGNVGKLRSQREKEFKAQAHNQSPISKKNSDSPSCSRSPSPPPLPIGSKRRSRLATLLEEEEEDEEVRVSGPVTRRRRLVKKLGDDFDRVASPENNKRSDEFVVVSDSTVAVAPPVKRSRRLVKIGEAVKKVVKEKENKNKKVVEEGEKSPNSGIRVRTSPRLAKMESN